MESQKDFKNLEIQCGKAFDVFLCQTESTLQYILGLPTLISLTILSFFEQYAFQKTPTQS